MTGTLVARGSDRVFTVGRGVSDAGRKLGPLGSFRRLMRMPTPVAATNQSRGRKLIAVATRLIRDRKPQDYHTLIKFITALKAIAETSGQEFHYPALILARDAICRYYGLKHEPVELREVRKQFQEFKVVLKVPGLESYGVVELFAEMLALSAAPMERGSEDFTALSRAVLRDFISYKDSNLMDGICRPIARAIATSHDWAVASEALRSVEEIIAHGHCRPSSDLIAALAIGMSRRDGSEGTRAKCGDSLDRCLKKWPDLVTTTMLMEVVRYGIEQSRPSGEHRSN